MRSPSSSKDLPFIIPCKLFLFSKQTNKKKVSLRHFSHSFLSILTCIAGDSIRLMNTRASYVQVTVRIFSAEIDRGDFSNSCREGCRERGVLERSPVSVRVAGIMRSENSRARSNHESLFRGTRSFRSVCPAAGVTHSSRVIVFFAG